MFEDEKINYTGYLRYKPQETDPEKQSAMMNAVVNALIQENVYGNISGVCYKDGHVEVSVNEKFYGVFDCNTGKFFDGYVGD